MIDNYSLKKPLKINKEDLDYAAQICEDASILFNELSLESYNDYNTTLEHKLMCVMQLLFDIKNKL
jgi:hypothetical protein